MTNETNELAHYLLERHLAGRRKTNRYADDDGPPVHEWELVTLDDLEEQANAAHEQTLDYFNHYIAGDR